MEMAFSAVLKIPRSTAQQRRFTSGGNHPTPGMRRAAATWQALFERFAPVEPFGAGVPLEVELLLAFDRPGPVAPKVTRPDVDNLAKMMLDAMTRARYWVDDNQVASLRVAKCTCDNRGGGDILFVRVSETMGVELPDWGAK